MCQHTTLQGSAEQNDINFHTAHAHAPYTAAGSVTVTSCLFSISIKSPHSSRAAQLALRKAKLMFGSDCMHDLAGAEWSSLCPMSRRHRNETIRLYGLNDMSVVRPSMLRLAGAVLAYPPFIVQVR